MKRLTDREISAATMQMRIEAGGSATVCGTCCCDRHKPYRHQVAGAIVEGCVDASHTEDMLALAPTDPDRVWHEREEAQALREGDLLRLKRIEADLLGWWERRERL